MQINLCTLIKKQNGEDKVKINTKTIELKVVWHAFGNRTLMQSIDGAVHTDLKGVFFCNSDSAEFYRAVAKLIAKLASQGNQVGYKDTHAPCDNVDAFAS